MADKRTHTTGSEQQTNRDSARPAKQRSGRSIHEIGRLDPPRPLKERDAPTPPPKPPALHLGHLRLDQQDDLKGWVREHNAPKKTAGDLDDNEMSFVVRTQAQQIAGAAGRAAMELDKAVHKAMVKFTPKLAQPGAVKSSLSHNLHHVFSHPAMIDFWEAWAPERGERGPAGMDAAAKSVLMMLAMGGGGKHILKVHSELCESEPARKIFAGVELAATLRAHEDGEIVAFDDFLVPNYSSVHKRIKALTRLELARPLMLQASARMFRPISEQVEGAGRRLLVDGRLFPGWARQEGKGKTEEEELEIRRTSPDAGARAYIQTKKGKREIGYDEVVRAGEFARYVRFVRGFYLVTILDQATGYPLISTVMDASINETVALRPLLMELFHYYPYLAPELIVGDGLYDIAELYRMCKLEFGMDLVARPTDQARPKNGKVDLPAEALKNGIAGMSHEGELRCAEHGEILEVAAFEEPSREGLRPGEIVPGHLSGKEKAEAIKARERRFRLRLWHRCGRGTAKRIDFQVRFNWRRARKYARSATTDVKSFAEGLALGMRRQNQGEGYFSALQVGLGLTVGGADRMRLRDMDTVAAVIGGGEMRYRALKYAGFLAERGESPPSLPDAPVGPPPIPGQGGSKAPRKPSSGGSGSGAGSSKRVDPGSEQPVVSAESTTVTETAPTSAATPGRFRRRDGSRPARRPLPSRRPRRRRRDR